MLSATKAYICAAFMAWAGTTDTATSPSWVSSIAKERNSAVQWESLQIQIGKFVDEYMLTEFDIERAWQEQLEQQCQQKENQRALRSAGNDDEMTAISSPTQQPYSSGMSINNTLTYTVQCCVCENEVLNYIISIKIFKYWYKAPGCKESQFCGLPFRQAVVK